MSVRSHDDREETMSELDQAGPTVEPEPSRQAVQPWPGPEQTVYVQVVYVS